MRLVKNAPAKGDTTITIKVDAQLKKDFTVFCALNDINQKQTIEAALREIINTKI